MDIAAIVGRTSKAIHPYFILSRPFNALAILLSFAAGFYFFSPQHQSVNLISGLFILLFLHSAWSAQNDIYDIDVDTANKRRSPLVTKVVSVKSASQFVTNLTILALAPALLSPQKITYLFFIVVLVIFGWQYNGPPLRLSRRPIASVVMLGLCYGLVPILFGFVASGNHLTSGFIAFAVLWALQRSSISILKDYKDEAGDRQHNKNTFLLAYGRRPVALISNVLSVTSYTSVILLLYFYHHMNTGYCVALFLLALVLVKNRIRLFRGGTNAQLNGVFKKSFIGENHFGGAVLLCLILS